jgi:LPXTG-motif cell wall-anchored protein
MGEWVVTKAPTTEEEGEKTRACKHTDHCDYTETAAVAKLDPELPPVTGDITPYIAMTAMTVVALIAAAGYVVLKRKAV